VPLSGFLNLSADSWLNLRFAALFRAATVPGTPLQSVPLARIACPSRDALAPLQLSTRVPRRAARALSPTVSADSHAFTRLPGVPGRLCPPFPPTRRPASRAELGSNDELAAYRELRLLRSVLPLTNPFATDASCPPSAAVTLLGFFPSRVFSDHASNPRPARTRRFEHAPCTRRHKTRDPEELCNPEGLLRPPDPGGAHLKCRSTQANSVGGFQPLCEASPDHLSVASSPPMVFRAAGEPAAPDLRSL